MSKAFASHGDLMDKAISFDELGSGLFAFTAEGDPNSGVIVGDDGVIVIDTQATPVMAQEVISRIQGVTDRPVSWIVLSHYHAVRVLGAAAYGARGVIASQGTLDLIKERGQQDYESEVGRFPRLFRAVESIPGLTWPDIVFERRLTVRLGTREVELMHLGRGHTKGDTIAWLPKERVLYAGDLVECQATPYTGDAYLRDWPATLQKLRELQPECLVPGRGRALTSARDCLDAIDATDAFVRALYEAVSGARAKGATLKQAYDEANSALRPRFGNWVIFDHCMPFDVSRAYDEAGGVDDPNIWTAERDVAMWEALERSQAA
ncbi:MBL fold metallo-hydrolase [Zavarzinia sp. CC-PAN008]|uniref:MBL fold metallo-hydrolase n=1 Tax=Zavarzinia sp. CC-PAN008 TaxID=3243332 RepID=UPI003F746EFE